VCITWKIKKIVLREPFYRTKKLNFFLYNNSYFILVRVLVSDIESSSTQVKLYVIASADPISFPLAGMKLTRRDITFRFIVWLVGLFIGIAKQKT
jgi:hypothetical protein